MNEVPLIRNIKNTGTLEESENKGTNPSLTSFWLSDCEQLCDVSRTLLPKLWECCAFQRVSTYGSWVVFRGSVSPPKIIIHLVILSIHASSHPSPRGSSASPTFSKACMTKRLRTLEPDGLWEDSGGKVYNMQVFKNHCL